MLYEHKSQVLELLDLAAPLVPEYLINAVDINEALDPYFGVGNCAVRAFLLGSLVNDVIGRNGGILARFGFTEETHGIEEDGTHVYGHAAIRLDSSDRDVVIIDSRDEPKAFLSYDLASFPYRWYGVEAGYRRYLQTLAKSDIEFSTDDTVNVARKRMGLD